MSTSMKASSSSVSCTPDLDDPSLYINREISLLQFNYRVLKRLSMLAAPLRTR